MGFLDGLSDAATSVADGVSGGVESVTDGVSSGVETVAHRASSAAESMGGVVDAQTEAVSGAIDTLSSNLTNELIDTLTSSGRMSVDAAGQVVDQFVSGLDMHNLFFRMEPEDLAKTIDRLPYAEQLDAVADALKEALGQELGSGAALSAEDSAVVDSVVEESAADMLNAVLLM